MSYQCTKCGHTEYEDSEIRASGGFWSRVFNVEQKRFITISCTRCGYTELYKRSSSALGNVIDFLAG